MPTLIFQTEASFVGEHDFGSVFTGKHQANAEGALAPGYAGRCAVEQAPDLIFVEPLEDPTAPGRFWTHDPDSFAVVGDGFDNQTVNVRVHASLYHSIMR